MNENFIAKLQTDKYLIGSFDAYLELSKALIKSNSNISDEDMDVILKSMPTTFRAAITDKNGDYVGYIGLYNVDAKNNTSSIRFEVNKDLEKKDQEEILNEFRKYLFSSLSITEIEELIYKMPEQTKIERCELVPNSNIILSSEFLMPGISEEDLERFSQDYTIPKFQ